MVRIAGSGAYHIVVVDQKTTEGDVARVIVLPERKAVVRLGPVSPGQETQPRATQLNARRIRPRRTHWFSIADRRNRGSPPRRTLTSCPLAPALIPSRLDRNRSGTIRGRLRYMPATRKSL